MKKYYVGLIWGVSSDGLWARLMIDPKKELDVAIFNSPEEAEAEWKTRPPLGFSFKAVELSN